MLLENRFYRLVWIKDHWFCEQVDADSAKIDFDWCKSRGRDCRFTIRYFANGVSFLLYSPHATHAQLINQANRMVEHTAP